MRHLFPFFEHASLVYLDSAASSQKLAEVIDATTAFYTHQYTSINRSSYPMANQNGAAYEAVRQDLAALINAPQPSNIVFTAGATHSLNLVANGMCIEDLQGDELLVLASEHHANLLPWQALCKNNRLSLKVVHLNSDGTTDPSWREHLLSHITQNTAIIAMAHVSNVLGNIYPVKEVCEKARRMNCLSVIDGTQAIAHMAVDVQDLGCDFYAFSAHKMYGPTGVGVLFGRSDCLEKLSPNALGGEMISHASFTDFECLKAPLKFETGTANTAGIIAFAPAIRFIKDNIERIVKHEEEIYAYLIDRLRSFTSIKVLGNLDNSIGVVSFIHSDFDANDIAFALYQQNVAIRAGSHCAMPLLQSLNIDSCVRVSLGCYSNKEDIDRFILILGESLDLLCISNEMPVENDLAGVTEKAYDISMPIASRIHQAKNWDNKHRQLLLASKLLSILPESLRIDTSIVDGCESTVWLAFDDKQLKAFSGSKVIRGILAILCEKANTLSYTQMSSFDYAEYLNSIGLSSYFSEGRKNGIAQAIKRIQLISKALI